MNYFLLIFLGIPTVLAQLAVSDLILITTLEGKIHALNRAGYSKWSVDIGHPLIHSHYSEGSFESTEPPYILTIHGDLISPSPTIASKLDFSIRDLVSFCPMIRDSTLHLGEKRMRAYLLDPRSGELLGSYDNLHLQSHSKKEGLLLIGFIDYVYSVLNIRTMEMIYNITYTEVMPTHHRPAVVSSLSELGLAVQQIKEFGTLTGVYSIEGGDLTSYALTHPEGLSRVKIESLSGGALYAKFIEYDSKDEGGFPIALPSAVPMLEGPTEQQERPWGLLLLFVLVWLYFKRKPVTRENKQVSHREIGSLLINTNTVLGQGSQGTTVFEGTFQHRAVAVKRMLKNYLSQAKQELVILLKADKHPNVVTFYALEQDETFVYIALEKCIGTLETYINMFSHSRKTRKRARAKLTAALPGKHTLLHGVAQGLAYLHSLNIVHRDIKPMNILIDEKGTVKIADMASGKSLHKDQSSFRTQAHGSAGWQPAEVLLNKRRTKAVDVFSLGCTFYYTLTNGLHPFGNRVNREQNILNEHYDLTALQPEERHLIRQMIKAQPGHRPTAQHVCHHCMFWTVEMKLGFMQNLSDRLEAEGNGSLYEIELQQHCSAVIAQPWDTLLDPSLLLNIRRYRKYDFLSVKDLLRVIRNKKHHIHELPDEIKKKIGTQEAFFGYFNKLFPELLISLFDFVERRAPDPLYTAYLE